MPLSITGIVKTQYPKIIRNVMAGMERSVISMPNVNNSLVQSSLIKLVKHASKTQKMKQILRPLSAELSIKEFAQRNAKKEGIIGKIFKLIQFEQKSFSPKEIFETLHNKLFAQKKLAETFQNKAFAQKELAETLGHKNKSVVKEFAKQAEKTEESGLLTKIRKTFQRKQTKKALNFTKEGAVPKEPNNKIIEEGKVLQKPKTKLSGNKRKRKIKTKQEKYEIRQYSSRADNVKGKNGRKASKLPVSEKKQTVSKSQRGLQEKCTHSNDIPNRHSKKSPVSPNSCKSGSSHKPTSSPFKKPLLDENGTKACTKDLPSSTRRGSHKPMVNSPNGTQHTNRASRTNSHNATPHVNGASRTNSHNATPQANSTSRTNFNNATHVNGTSNVNSHNTTNPFTNSSSNINANDTKIKPLFKNISTSGENTVPTSEGNTVKNSASKNINEIPKNKNNKRINGKKLTRGFKKQNNNQSNVRILEYPSASKQSNNVEVAKYNTTPVEMPKVLTEDFSVFQEKYGNDAFNKYAEKYGLENALLMVINDVHNTGDEVLNLALNIFKSNQYVQEKVLLNANVSQFNQLLKIASNSTVLKLKGRTFDNFFKTSLLEEKVKVIESQTRKCG